ncbi:MAG: CHAT domain-containing protein, partial [Candidatus Aminicenantes bacterium]|nr:CHAT domain-containing protein [Candidatus Aminicenantes bacterium]
LWEVNDKSTAKFMSYFYKYLSVGNSKSQALRMAKIKMLKSEYSHPFYWASFVLYGDFSPVPIFN